MECLSSQDRKIADRHDSLPFLVLLGISVVLGGLLLTQFSAPSYVFGPIALISACVATLAYWPRGGLLVILIASVMPRLSVGVGGWNARPEHFAVALVVVVFVIRTDQNPMPVPPAGLRRLNKHHHLTLKKVCCEATEHTL